MSDGKSLRGDGRFDELTEVRLRVMQQQTIRMLLKSADSFRHIASSVTRNKKRTSNKSCVHCYFPVLDRNSRVSLQENLQQGLFF